MPLQPILGQKNFKQPILGQKNLTNHHLATGIPKRIEI